MSVFPGEGNWRAGKRWLERFRGELNKMDGSFELMEVVGLGIDRGGTVVDGVKGARAFHFKLSVDSRLNISVDNLIDCRFEGIKGVRITDYELFRSIE